jgi:NitT/TauT family transport system substrate-binding protein
VNGSFAILAAAFVMLSASACDRSARSSRSGPSAEAAPSAAASPGLSGSNASGPLRIAYSDWPGWAAWDIAIQKGYFKDAGVEVSFQWLEYVPSMEAFSDGKVDAVGMTNGDALVAGTSGALSVGIVINDYSNGNDMVVARPGISKMAELKGKKIGVEVGVVDHLLLMEALKSANMTESDVEIVNTKTHEAPALLKSGAVSAIAAWQPNSGYALEQVPGSTSLFTSANVPGLIYDALFVKPRSLNERRADWKKVVKVWFRVASFVNDPAHRAEAARIMSAKTKLTPQSYDKLMGGTRFLGAEENKRRFQKTKGLDSVQGSSEIVDEFNVANRVYKDRMAVDPFFDASLVNETVTEAAR